MRFFLLPLLLLCNMCMAQTAVPADALPGQYVPLLQHKKVALVANQTSTVGDSLLVDMLLARRISVVRIMVPEHGFRGKEDAGVNVDNSTDSATGLPVVSLYGSHKKPRPEDLADVDVVIYDLQDVGVRFYTYISTLEYVMEACAENHKQLMILDRPNPNGFYVDGPVLEPANKSFVGMQPIPIVYGMTAGEYATMLKGEGWVSGAKELNLQVVPCSHYRHETRYRLTVPPSPNLRNMTAIYAYPSLCLFEGTPVSVGRGTDLPFQQFGCPEFKGTYTHSFTPQSAEGAKHPPYEGKTCYGEVAGRNEQEILKAINGHMRLQWVIAAYKAYPDKEKFFTSFFTKLSGTQQLQEQIKEGKTEAQIWESWQPGLEKFKEIRKNYLLYK